MHAERIERPVKQAGCALQHNQRHGCALQIPYLQTRNRGLDSRKNGARRTFEAALLANHLREADQRRRDDAHVIDDLQRDFCVEERRLQVEQSVGAGRIRRSLRRRSVGFVSIETAVADSVCRVEELASAGQPRRVAINVGVTSARSHRAQRKNHECSERLHICYQSTMSQGARPAPEWRKSQGLSRIQTPLHSACCTNETIKGKHSTKIATETVTNVQCAAKRETTDAG